MLRKRSNVFKIFSLSFLIIITFNAILSLNSLKFGPYVENLQDKTIDFYNLKISGQQINITTPENKLYTEPMSGYYPATYGFENDMGGGSPNEWILIETGGTVDVQNTLDDHNRVIRFYDTSTVNPISARNEFENQTTGIVEWWFKKTSGSTACYFNFHGGTDFSESTRAIEIGIDIGDNGAFGIRNGSGSQWQYDYNYSDNTWYHLKVEFDCGNHNFTVYKNGIPMFVNASFWYKMDNINLMIIGTNSFRAGTFYADAIGFSWDPNYNIGDNMNEGLLLSFDLGFNPDWQAYSLDGQTNRTILGNSTISIPTPDGMHTVQVFGNDSLATMYQSDMRYFYIGYIPLEPPVIPGYESFVIIAVISIVSVILIKKKFKSKL